MAKTKRFYQPDDDPWWYKDAVIYELHVRAFYDSDGDGIGDFRGLTEKLDYLQDLGVTAVWLLPFYPSPLRDDGYDIADYTNVHPFYGTLRDFRHFLREAKWRGLRVITELVLNHTSDEHPWFQRARRAAPRSRHRQFYVWSDSPDKYQETRIIFKDFESSNWAWDPVARQYYWHRFYSHQPDLNYQSADVRRAMMRVLHFWLSLGVDGLRLDAVPYLFEREGTNCENLPETHAFLKELRRYVDQHFRNRMLLAEANQWPEDAAAYFGQGDECHMAFHFPLMPRMFMALRMEDRFPIIDILQQTPPIPENCQWALFLRNHDELTLEMVTDEERDYMYRVYSQDPQARLNLGIRRRLAPLLGNHRRRIELMKGLLFAMPGTPVIYYGDEIGMGDNIYLGDRDGVRTPMQWSADRNAGFSKANAQRLYLPVIIDPEYHYEAVNVEAQQNNPYSLLWWMKRLIAMRKRHKALSRGSIEFLYPDNHKILAFIRRYEGERLLVVANLSRFVQYAELNLAGNQGLVPVELMGRVEFPIITERPYLLTLGPHGVYWFSLEEPQAAHIHLQSGEAQIPTFSLAGTVEDLFRGKDRPLLADLLLPYLASCRWFGGKAKNLKDARIIEAIPFPYNGGIAYWTLVEVEYLEGEPETYLLPLTLAMEDQTCRLLVDSPQEVVGRLEGGGLLYEPWGDSNFRQALLDCLARRRHYRGLEGELWASTNQVFRHIQRLANKSLPSRILKTEQSNTSIVYGEWYILKVLRRLEEGMNLDLEIGRFLTEKTAFAHNPPVAGALEYRRNKHQPVTLGILHGYVPNQGEAWEYTLDVLASYFEEALAGKKEPPPELLPQKPLVHPIREEIPPLARELIGPYLESARLLGERTAELHLALASDTTDPDFAPEPFTTLYQRSMYQSMRSLSVRVLHLLRNQLNALPASVREHASKVLELEVDIMQRFRALLHHKINALRLRVHGDYHLGQILYTGKDFVIIDFEGEPARPLTERRLKRTPLRDVAGMLRSFHYAAYHAIFSQTTRTEDLPAMEKWAEFWYCWVSRMFFWRYLDLAGTAKFLPDKPEDLQLLVDLLCLEKAIYELGYELNNRPAWVKIPLQGILQLVQ